MRESNPREREPNPLSKSANRDPGRFAGPLSRRVGCKSHSRERGRTWTNETKTETASGRHSSVGVRSRCLQPGSAFLADHCPRHAPVRSSASDQSLAQFATLACCNLVRLGPIAHLTRFRGLLTAARVGTQVCVNAEPGNRRHHVNAAERARMRLRMRLTLGLCCRTQAKSVGGRGSFTEARETLWPQSVSLLLPRV